MQKKKNEKKLTGAAAAAAAKKNLKKENTKVNDTNNDAGGDDAEDSGPKGARVARDNGGVAGYWAYRAHQDRTKYGNMLDQMQKKWEGTNDDERKAIALAMQAARSCAESMGQLKDAYEALIGASVEDLLKGKKAKNMFSPKGGRRHAQYDVGTVVQFNARNEKRYGDALGIKPGSTFKIEAVIGSLYKVKVGDIELLLEGSKIETPEEAENR